MMHLIKVLLPLPLVPSSATVSPSRTSMETPWRTRTAPYPAATSRTTILLAKIGLLDGRIAHDLRRSALGDSIARVEDHDPLREAHDRAHDVLDHDDRDPLLVQPEQDREDVVHLGAGESRHGLVGDQELRPRRHRAGQLELAHLDLGEAGRPKMSLVAQADHREDLTRPGDGAGRARVGRVLQRDVEVLEHGHARERLRNLKAPNDTEPRPLVRGQARDVTPLEQDAAAVRRQGARHAVDQGGLAGAVGSDQAQALAGSDPDRHAVERQEASEALAHGVDLEERRAHRLLRRRTRPRRPSGASTTKSTSTTPTIKRLSSDEIVTVATCCAVPRRTAPITGPSHVVVPPIIGIASAFTA